MKALVFCVLGILAAAVIGFGMFSQRTEAQSTTRYAPAPGTPPIGAVCEVQVIASVLSTSSEKFTLRGNLLAMSGEWVVLKDGSFENWIPREKVVYLRASR